MFLKKGKKKRELLSWDWVKNRFIQQAFVKIKCSSIDDINN